MKMLVHLHVYYHEQVPWFLSKLRNIQCVPWDLLVTWSVPDSATEALVRECKPDARFMQVENRGYDIWPFLKLTGSVSLDAYDIILKLHTKHITGKKTIHINHMHLKGAMWRDILVDDLIGTPERVMELVSVFQAHPEVGMACSGRLYSSMEFPEDHALLEAEMNRLGLHTDERRFCVGSMLALRPAVLQVLDKEQFEESQFARDSATDSSGTLAHVYERILSLLAPAQGYRVHLLGIDEEYLRLQWRKEHIQKALNWFFRLDHEGPDRQKYLTLFGLKCKIGKPQ